LQLFSSTDGSTTINYKRAEIDMWLNKCAVTRVSGC